MANKDGSDWDRVSPPVPWDAPTGEGTPSVPSDSSSSTGFSSSSSPSSPGPLKMVLEAPENPPTTPENEFDLLGPLPSFHMGSSIQLGPQLRNCWGAIKRSSWSWIKNSLSSGLRSCLSCRRLMLNRHDFRNKIKINE
ncbi:hypothetical protein O181_099407 [Austropuccinia psidii MF-1]|uniref:Uncharacterized protein n=1 Tax=Austropuccinia psidii MF-1 TaxID=1389203 RepID=A0A9Q3JC80_9BASI|nr:hypothetical protein [Austropuccinia psidii MF-1]